ncbi:MAG: DUF4295 family protein [Flavobacteriaceae bacterium]|nr:DUF4295 family protein [Cryomorphaceae bacterium]MBL6677633.1 DUF4295 family protein [Flavobacteriaceae bacterium]
MAKKAVASLQTGSKKLTKAIRMIKKDGSNSYSFDEKILPQDLVNDWLAGKLTEKEQPIPVKPAAEVPKVEEPAAEVPKVEEPALEEPKAEEPALEEPKAEEPASEEPKAEEPASEEPTR